MYDKIHYKLKKKKKCVCDCYNSEKSEQQRNG